MEISTRDALMAWLGDSAYFFTLIGILTIACVFAILLVFAKDAFDISMRKRIAIKKGADLDHCCQKCGAYTKYYTYPGSGLKLYYIKYCPHCGHDMLEDRWNKDFNND